MDSSVTETRKDKNDMVDGNDRFLHLIDEVIKYETTNKQLEEQLRIIRLKKNHTKKVDKIVMQAKQDLEQQVKMLQGDQNQLVKRLSDFNEEDLQHRYEENQKGNAKLKEEILKITKDLEDERVKKVGLMAEKTILNQKLELLREGFKEEIKELKSHIQNEKKVISNTKRRSLDLEPIIQSLRAHYAGIAERTKQEADQLNRKKIETLRQTSEQYEKETEKILKKKTIVEKNIADLKRELEIQKEKEEILKKELEQEEGGDAEKTRLEIIKLDDQLKDKKEELVQQVRDYQKLLDLKMGLKMEIATYRELLKNEEESLKDTSSDVYKTNQTKAAAKKKNEKVAR